MSRLAAQKEFAFMKVLGENGFRVPEAVAWSRHTVVMGLIEGVPLRAVKEVGDPGGLYGELMEVILRLARHGLIHGDFNEFNIMVQEEENEGEELPRVIPWIIDFPQTISIDHANAEFYFDRDVNCIKTFFERRFHFTSSESGPFFEDAKIAAGTGKDGKGKRLDIEVEASGFSRKMAKELEKYMQDVGVDGDGHGEGMEGCSESEQSEYGASDENDFEHDNAKYRDMAKEENAEASQTLAFESLQITREPYEESRGQLVK